jgi:hypothetical protein
MIRLSGRMTPRVIASRSSATFLPEKSTGVRDEAADAALAAPWPALRAPFAAVCWRPRALPPAFAARLRAGVLAELERLEEPERLEALDRLEAPDLRELDDALLALDFRALVPPDFDAVDFRAVDRDPEPVLAPELRELLDLRALDPPDRDFADDDLLLDELLRDEPPPLPPVDSAISSPPQEASRPLGPRRTISCPASR